MRTLKVVFPAREADIYDFYFKGGLDENGRLTKEIIQKFDELYRTKEDMLTKTVDGRRSARECLNWKH